VLSTPFPTLAPLPTFSATTTDTSSTSTSSNTGNPNCTTGAGEPNSWYSDVYPNPPITTNTGSVGLIVVIRDCYKSTVSANDKLQISLISGDPNTKINDQTLPYTLNAQNGQANFYVTSQISGSVTLKVTDTTKSFDITDINNHNPTVTFSGNSSGNPNCTTGPGTANFWYSEVDPASAVSTNTGSSVSFTVNIKDCNKNDVSTTESLTITQTTSDSGFTINGSSSPVNISAPNGQTTFSVSSPNAGTVNFTVRDITSSFTITDQNNHNPSVIFSNSSSTNPTPTPTNTPSSSPTDTPTPTSSQSVTPNPTPTQSDTPTLTPTGS